MNDENTKKVQNKENEKEEIAKNEEIKEKKIEESRDKEELNNNKKEEQTETKEKKKSPLRIIGKITGIISKILLVAILALAVVVLVRVTILHKQDFFGYRFYIIMSGSMEPTIDREDLVITKEQDTPFQKGDIIAFEHNESINVHRIVEVFEENGQPLYETKGDNNNMADLQKMKQENVKGKVVYTARKVGKAILYVTSHFLIIVYILAFIIIIILIRRLLSWRKTTE